MIGPVQYEFTNPIPYLAVPPNEKDLYINTEKDYKNTENCFASVHNYNFNELTYNLCQ